MIDPGERQSSSGSNREGRLEIQRENFNVDFQPACCFFRWSSLPGQAEQLQAS
jgi:hypothetical protein